MVSFSWRKEDEDEMFEHFSISSSYRALNKFTELFSSPIER